MAQCPYSGTDPHKLPLHSANLLVTVHSHHIAFHFIPSHLESDLACCALCAILYVLTVASSDIEVGSTDQTSSHLHRLSTRSLYPSHTASRIQYRSKHDHTHGLQRSTTCYRSRIRRSHVRPFASPVHKKSVTVRHRVHNTAASMDIPLDHGPPQRQQLVEYGRALQVRKVFIVAASEQLAIDALPQT